MGYQPTAKYGCVGVYITKVGKNIDIDVFSLISSDTKFELMRFLATHEFQTINIGTQFNISLRLNISE